MEQQYLDKEKINDDMASLYLYCVGFSACGLLVVQLGEPD